MPRRWCVDHPSQRVPGAEEFHFDGGNGFSLELRNIRNGEVLDVEGIRDRTFSRRKKAHGVVEPFDLAPEVEIILEVGALGNEALVNHLDRDLRKDAGGASGRERCRVRSS